MQGPWNSGEGLPADETASERFASHANVWRLRGSGLLFLAMLASLWTPGRAESGFKLQRRVEPALHPAAGTLMPSVKPAPSKKTPNCVRRTP